MVSGILSYFQKTLFRETYFVTLPRQSRLSSLYFKSLWNSALSYVDLITGPEVSVYQIDIKHAWHRAVKEEVKKSVISYPKCGTTLL